MNQKKKKACKIVELLNYAERTSIEEKLEEKDNNLRIIRKWTKTKRRTKYKGWVGLEQIEDGEG